uniref:Uncharacterized protein n=1 Tax=Romanomermis culicivorax TaxID=13658 RepID=A0A915JSM3_ROMCU
MIHFSIQVECSLTNKLRKKVFGDDADALVDKICSRFPSQSICQSSSSPSSVGNTATPPPPPPPTSQSTAAPATPPPPAPPASNQTAPVNSSSNFPPNQANFCTQNNDYFVGYCSPKSGKYQVEQAVYNFCYDYSKRCNRPLPFGLTPVQPGSTPTNTQPLNPNLPAVLQSQSPLGGLGGVNSGNFAQYGGPVQGGLGIGKSFQVPFVGASSGTNVVPTEGFQSGKGLNVAGIGIQSSSGVNWGGIPGVSNLNQALGLSPNAVLGNQQPSSVFSGRRKRHTFLTRLFFR